MIYGWLIGGLGLLDFGVKEVIEAQEDETFPRDLPCARGWIRLYKNHNSGFPFGFLEKRPQLVKGVPLMVVSALAGALAALMDNKDALLERLGLAIAIGGAISNIYDRLVRGYVVDYFSIRWKGLKNVVFNLGDIFIFLGGSLVAAAQVIKSLKGMKKQ